MSIIAKEVQLQTRRRKVNKAMPRTFSYSHEVIEEKERLASTEQSGMGATP
jgi:hypothetical protein